MKTKTEDQAEWDRLKKEHMENEPLVRLAKETIAMVDAMLAVPAAPGDAKELADLLSRVLRHPLIPTRLYNAMVDELNCVAPDHHTSPEYLAQCVVELARLDQASEAIN